MKIKSKIKNIYKSSWFITIFATMFGVLLAFYLDDLSSRSRIENRKQVSIRNIENELTHNIAELRDLDDNKKLTDFLEKIKKINSEIPTKLTMTVHSMNDLRINYLDFIEISDSVKTDANIYEYNFVYKFELNLDGLQNIAWETFKMNDISNELDYNCLQALVKIYSLQEIYINEQQKVLNYFINAEHKKLLRSLNIAQQLQSKLLNVIHKGQEEIKKCY